MKRKVQAQRKFAQGAPIPVTFSNVNSSERRIDTTSNREEQRNVVRNNTAAKELLDFISFKQIHKHKRPVVLLERLKTNSVKPHTHDLHEEQHDVKATDSLNINSDNDAHIQTLNDIENSSTNSPNIPLDVMVLELNDNLNRDTNDSMTINKNAMYLRSRSRCNNKKLPEDSVENSETGELSCKAYVDDPKANSEPNDLLRSFNCDVSDVSLDEDKPLAQYAQQKKQSSTIDRKKGSRILRRPSVYKRQFDVPRDTAPQRSPQRRCRKRQIDDVTVREARDEISSQLDHFKKRTNNVERSLTASFLKIRRHSCDDIIPKSEQNDVLIVRTSANEDKNPVSTKKSDTLSDNTLITSTNTGHSLGRCDKHCVLRKFFSFTDIMKAPIKYIVNRCRRCVDCLRMKKIIELKVLIETAKDSIKKHYDSVSDDEDCYFQTNNLWRDQLILDLDILQRSSSCMLRISYCKTKKSKRPKPVLACSLVPKPIRRKSFVVEKQYAKIILEYLEKSFYLLTKETLEFETANEKVSISVNGMQIITKNGLNNLTDSSISDSTNNAQTDLSGPYLSRNTLNELPTEEINVPSHDDIKVPSNGKINVPPAVKEQLFTNNSEIIQIFSDDSDTENHRDKVHDTDNLEDTASPGLGIGNVVTMSERESLNITPRNNIKIELPNKSDGNNQLAENDKAPSQERNSKTHFSTSIGNGEGIQKTIDSPQQLNNKINSDHSTPNITTAHDEDGEISDLEPLIYEDDDPNEVSSQSKLTPNLGDDADSLTPTIADEADNLTPTIADEADNLTPSIADDADKIGTADELTNESQSNESLTRFQCSTTTTLQLAHQRLQNINVTTGSLAAGDNLNILFDCTVNILRTDEHMNVNQACTVVAPASDIIRPENVNASNGTNETFSNMEGPSASTTANDINPAKITKSSQMCVNDACASTSRASSSMQSSASSAESTSTCQSLSSFNKRRKSSSFYDTDSTRLRTTAHSQPSAGESFINAPVFRPTLEEFQDPVAYYETIMPIASKYGICKVVPPKEFVPSCELNDEMMFNVSNQYVTRLYSRWGPGSREMSTIKAYLASQSVYFKRAPLYEGMEVNLPKLYQIVQRNGGLKKVIERKRWSRVAEEIRFTKGPNPEKKLDQFYVKYLLPYDTLSPTERSNIMSQVERAWCEKYRKMTERAFEPLLRQEKILGGTESSDEEGDCSDDDPFITGSLIEAEECVMQGRKMNLTTFKKVASHARESFFSNTTPSTSKVEEEYWRLVLLGSEHLCVISASIDTGTAGYGFTSKPDEEYGSHPWNLKNLAKNKGNILRYLGPVLGVTVPTLHLGMVFSTSCWHSDPHGLPWMEYMHSGPPKIWYGIPDEQNTRFRKAVETLCPTSCQNKTIWLPSDIAMIPPTLLREQNVILSRVEQHPGEYILVFPKAYSCSISTGYTVSESVYFATRLWLQHALEFFMEAQTSCEPTTLSLEALLMAMVADGRIPLAQLQPALVVFHSLLQVETTQRKLLHDELATRKLRNGIIYKKHPPGVWNVREQEECDVCRKSLFLSLISGLTRNHTSVCLEHGTGILKSKAGKNIPLPEFEIYYFFCDEELNAVMKKAGDRLFKIT